MIKTYINKKSLHKRRSGMKKQIASISNEEIWHALENNRGQYLVGIYSFLPQALKHIDVYH